MRNGGLLLRSRENQKVVKATGHAIINQTTVIG